MSIPNDSAKSKPKKSNVVEYPIVHRTKANSYEWNYPLIRNLANLKPPGEDFRTKTKPHEVADWIMDQVYILKWRNDDLYLWQHGNYNPGGDRVLEQLSAYYYDCIERRERATTRTIKEILNIIGRKVGYLEDRPDMHLVNCKNCLVSMQNAYNGAKIDFAHRPNLKTTIQIGARYDPYAKCPGWYQFLRSLFARSPNRDEYVELILDLFSWYIVPNDNVHRIVVLLGGGSNGKSMLLHGLEAFVGSNNVSNVSVNKIAEAGGFHTKNIVGKLLNIHDDADAGLPETGILKSISGGGVININEKFRDSYDYLPYCRLIFSANSMPKTPDISDGFYQRLLPIRLTETFPRDSNKDRELKEILTSDMELSGLLNQAISRWPRINLQGGSGLTIPKDLILEGLRMQRDVDTVGAFIKSRLEVGGREDKIGQKELYAEYQEYCEVLDLVDIKNPIWFGRELKRRLPQITKQDLSKEGERYFWRGLRHRIR